MTIRFVASITCSLILSACTLSTTGTTYVDEGDAGPAGSRATGAPAMGAGPDAGSGPTTVSTLAIDAGLVVPDVGPLAPAPPDATVAVAPDAAPITAPIDAAPLPPPVAPPPPVVPQPVATPVVLHAHDITAQHITARVLYAHRLDAKSATVAIMAPPPTPAELAQAGMMDVKAGELVADVIYAHDVHAMSIVVVEVHLADGGKMGKDENAVPPP